MIYDLSCGCEPQYPGKPRTRPGDAIYCPQHGFVTITAITRPPTKGRLTEKVHIPQFEAKTEETE